MRRNATLIFLLLLSVWAGIIIGVSFLATPVKFQAPSLTLPTAVEIGRYTFRLLARLELGFLITALALAVMKKPAKKTMTVFAFVIIIMALQQLWLLPVLDGRVSQLLSGSTLTSSLHHVLYAVTEAIKAILLLTTVVIEYRHKSTLQ